MITYSPLNLLRTLKKFKQRLQKRWGSEEPADLLRFPYEEALFEDDHWKHLPDFFLYARFG